MLISHGWSQSRYGSLHCSSLHGNHARRPDVPQAPEVLFGQSTSFSADIYSYGVLLLEIISGLRQRRGDYHRPVVPKECPASIAELALHCMAVEPEARPCAQDVIDCILASVAVHAQQHVGIESDGIAP